MINLRFTLRGSKKVEQKIQHGVNLKQAIKPAMLKGVLYVHSQVPAYPSASPESNYTRTGNLGRSVTTMQGQVAGALSRVESLGSGAVGFIGSNMAYAPYVIDENRQAWMHKGRWWTLQSVVNKARSGVIKILRRSILDYLGE